MPPAIIEAENAKDEPVANVSEAKSIKVSLDEEAPEAHMSVDNTGRTASCTHSRSSTKKWLANYLEQPACSTYW